LNYLGTPVHHHRREGCAGDATPSSADFSDAYVCATYPFRFTEHLALFNEGLRRAGWKGTVELETVRQADETRGARR
jgi:hypothetical protein